MKFESWMKQVDLLLVDRYGFESSDFEDFRWADTWEDDWSPAQAVLLAERYWAGYD